VTLRAREAPSVRVPGGAESEGDDTASRTIPELVSDQAARVPGKTAVERGAERVSYAELADGAANIAGHLRARATTDDVVGIWLERSPAFVHAALGVLRAGAAYLPIDPRQPAARVRVMLEDAGASLVLTDGIRLGLRELEDAPFTAVRADELLDAPPSVPDPVPAPTLTDLAYVIYTSGSTGRPKGVEITHENLLHLVRWHQDAFTVREDDRASAIASPGFDASVWELWPYLTAGATVTIADDETRLSADALRSWLLDERVTICFLPTVLAETAIRQEWPEDTLLRTMLTGGDTLHVYPPDHLPFALVNNYGPAECTVVTTSGTITGAPRSDELPSIGRPIANVQVHLLNEQLQPVPPGAVGEIYVGGAGVSRGYRNDPHLTAERFVADPWTERPDARLYRTGDRGRYREDGTVEFCGRLDTQTKIRGNRVEPDEVAYHLDLHPRVLASCVVAVPGDAGETQLAAYFVPATADVPPRSELAQFLRDRLPEFMVPASFNPLADLPLTPNGKIDRATVVALHEAARSGDVGGPVELSEASPEQNSATETRLADLVGTLLQVEELGPEDDFFLLGGHSLLAAQLMARIRDAFGAELPLRTIFDHPTIRELAFAIEGSAVAPVLETAAAGAPPSG
jgi:amino acid adenylation domain-containing protein